MLELKLADAEKISLRYAHQIAPLVMYKDSRHHQNCQILVRKSDYLSSWWTRRANAFKLSISGKKIRRSSSEIRSRSVWKDDLTTLAFFVSGICALVMGGNVTMSKAQLEKMGLSEIHLMTLFHMFSVNACKSQTLKWQVVFALRTSTRRMLHMGFRGVRNSS